MVELLEILILSIVQGIGEFLPISSSGHLLVMEHLFDRFGLSLTEDGADFIKLGVLLHVGTLIAVLIVFWRRILDLFGKDRRLIPLLIVATLPAVIAGLTIVFFAKWIVENLMITSICFTVTGILLLVTLRFSKGEKTCSEMTWLDALAIGCVQAVAILPGISRSGSTIVAGLCRSLRRDEAATFSFLLSIPVIILGGVYEIYHLFKEPHPEGTLTPLLLLIGTLLSCGVGVLALVWLLDWLKKGKLWYFALWVFAMSPITFALAVMPMPEKQARASEVQSPETEKRTGKPVEEKSDDQMSGEKPDDAEAGKDAKNSAKVDAPEKTDENSDSASATDSLTKAIEETEPSRLNMSREEALKEYERILAEEEAKELALIEEEQKRAPLVDDPEKLVPLDPKDRIWITPDGKSVVMLARVALTEGVLELFACRIGTKEHESIVSVRVKPFLIHAALLAVGAEAGKPVQVVPKFVPPSGDEIEILIRWNDESGNRKESSAQDWILDTMNSTETEKKTMSTHWVFTGSMTYRDEEGRNHYVADETGELVGLSNFVGAILDVPIKSSADNAELLFSCFTERIPEVGTPLTLILTPMKNKKR